AAFPFPVLRTASTTRALAPASARAVASPMPLLAPVTIAVLPAMPGMSAVVIVAIANNVVIDYYVVNVNFGWYAPSVDDPPYHHGRLRAALLTEAERVLREDGIEALSLRELARRAGVSHAAPRRHFTDRQALLDALAEAGFTRLADEMHAAI